MSRLSDLLHIASKLDPQLAKDLEREIEPLQKRLPFGLNFERHAPEAVELAGHRIRKGNKVRVLPPRGSTERGDQRLWHVDSISSGIAEISTPNGEERETQSVPVEDLVLVAEFRDRIYPGLRPDGSVERGGDKPFHTVINGENFHVLELLTFTHEHSVDAIYIDPPYNTGSRDWKYNNDYVEGDDLYRHSKWLAFMERRLRLAKRLLKPEDSVLIVTIDEKEYLRLGLLLGQVFPGVPTQMLSTVINPKGASLGRDFARVDEYVFILYIGRAGVHAETRDMLDEGKNNAPSTSVKWSSLIRGGAQGIRTDSPGAYYPVFVDPSRKRIHSFGEALPWDRKRSQVKAPPGTVAVWPPNHPSGVEGRWGIGPSKAAELYAIGALRLGRIDLENQRFPLSYLSSGIMAKVESGEIITEGRSSDGTLIVRYPAGSKTTQPKSVWKMPSHNAGEYGSKLLSAMLPQRKFPFPKALYAVEDLLRFFVSEKPNAVILDFFAGSGTTAHAVMRINKQDSGRRQCISVTNNEVSADEQIRLRSQGLRPGDLEWEKLGICEYITKPRIRAAITGLTPEGRFIEDNYKFVDEFPMAEGFEENAAFFTLTYESKWLVGVDRAFAAIAPMLWLRAGAVGSRIDSIEGGWAIADSYGILRDLDQAADFVEALRGRGGIRIVYVVTDDEGRYQQVADEIRGVETVRLYEDYLRNCEMTGDF
ncbi:site-specific DNA-methyltransferase [Pseudoclavibacter sp. CFCC 14310]|nr:site-specific DNA-methyltransferase [Pseudoclavibacter sp. CFCC 14310]